jgi:hypothetical protein
MRRAGLGRGTVAAVVAVSLLACAPSAQAKLDADYLFKFAFIEMTEVPIMTGQPSQGDSVCDPSLRTVGGGAFWDGNTVTPAEADEFWTSSLAPMGKRHWYAAGANVAGGSRGFSRYVQCLPKRKLRGATTRTKDFVLEDLEHGGGSVRCPDGKRLFGGGAFWHDGDGNTSVVFANDVWLSSSYPKSGKAWYADGENQTGDDYVLRVVVRCLPSSRLAKVKVRRTDHSLDDGETGGGAQGCPPGTIALTGGAYRHRAGGDPRPHNGGDFRVSSVFGDDVSGFPSDGYYADAYNFSGHDRPWILTVVARCLT